MNFDENDVDAVFDGFWKEIVMKDGILDLEQVKKELFDYFHIISGASKVYEHVTGGLISKPNADPRIVIQFADEHVDRLIESHTKELQEIIDGDQDG